MNQANIRQNYLIEKLVLTKYFWLLIVSFFFLYPLIKSVKRQLPAEQAILSTLPDFTFTNENGEPFGSKELRGRVYIANFVFTTCQTSCPLIFSKLQKVQHRLRGVVDRAAIVSFTVDPETDSVDVLYSKARELKANPFVWKFLRAPETETKNLLVDGFKVPLGDKTWANNVMDVAHSNKFVLVDQDGRIRGYYNAQDDDINRMMIDTGLLINRVEK